MLTQEAGPVRSGARASWLERSVDTATSQRALIALTAIGAAIRFATITSQSYWLDEAQAAHEVSLSLGHMLSAWSSSEWNPPLYLLIAWPWAHVFGNGEAGLRSLSAIFGVALIPVLYACGSELVSRRAGLVAALLVAVNPFMIWYSQEAREYMLLALLSAASLLFYARAWRTGSRRDLVWWAILSALALLTQYFAAFLVVAEAIVLIWRLRNRASVVAVALQGVVLAAFVPHVLPQLRVPATFITDQPLLLRLQQVPVTFALNQLYKSSLVHWGLVGGAVTAAAVIGLLLIGADDRELKGVGLAAIPAAAVLLIPLAMSLVGHDDYLARGLIPAWPPLAVVFAAACTTRRAPAAGAALTVILVGLFAWSGIRIDADRVFQRPDWRGVAAALGSTWAGEGGGQSRAIVTYPGDFASGPLSIDLHRTPWAGPGEAPGTDAGPATISEIDVVADAGQPLGASVDGDRLIARRDVDGYLVARFSLPAPASVTAATVLSRADALLATPSSQAPVMFQQPAG
jgi:4-amino-4-deoxy-L-arabinose transferase-like glycosyltransferase